FDLSLLPHEMQNFESTDVSLSIGFSCGGVIPSVGADSMPPYISVTAPLGLNESSVSGDRSESFFSPFSSMYTKSRGPRSPLGKFTDSPSHRANFLRVI